MESGQTPGGKDGRVYFRMDLRLPIGLILAFGMGLFGTTQVHAANPLSEDTPIEYLSAMDRVEIGDTPSALNILGRSLNKDDEHEPSVRLYFQLLFESVSEKEFIEKLKDHFSRTKKTSLFVELAGTVKLSPDSQFRLFRWGMRTLPNTSDLFFEVIRSARTAGQSSYVRQKSNLARDTYWNSPRVVGLYAEWYEEREEWPRASEFYKRYVSLRPGHPIGYEGLSRFYRARGNTKMSDLMAERASSLRE